MTELVCLTGVHEEVPERMVFIEMEPAIDIVLEVLPDVVILRSEVVSFLEST